MSFFAFYPPSGGGSANASVGTNGGTAPTSSTEVAGVTPGGTLQPVSVDNAGNQNVNVVASALPTGASTSSLQTSGNTLLGTIIVDLTNGSQITQITGTVPLASGASTSALQTSGNASLTSIDTKTPALGQAVAGSSVPVVLPAAQITALTPLSTVTVIQPTAANLNATVTGSVSVSNFPATQPVSGTVAVSTLPAITGSVSVTNFPATQAISAVSLPLPTGAATAAKQPALGTAGTSSTDIISVQGIAGGTPLPISGSITATNPSVSTTGTAVPASATMVGVKTGANLVALTTGQAVKASSLPVTLASDQGALATSAGGTAIANAPVINQYSTTAINTTTYVQLIASTATAANSIRIFDSSGQAMILAVGAAGSEVIQAYVPPGGDAIGLAIPAGSRIAIKALTATAASGYILINLQQ